MGCWRSETLRDFIAVAHVFKKKKKKKEMYRASEIA
jgi:hypothetical protein